MKILYFNLGRYFSRLRISQSKLGLRDNRFVDPLKPIDRILKNVTRFIKAI